jgi:hypothetical protein
MKLVSTAKSQSRLDSLVYRTNKENTFDFRWLEVKISGKNIRSRSNHVSVFFEKKLYLHGGYDADKGILWDFYCINLSDSQ